MPKTDLLQGTLDLLILKTLALGPDAEHAQWDQFALSMRRVLRAE